MFPIYVAQGIARWELEELVSGTDEQKKTELIRFGHSYVTSLEWIYPFVRRKLGGDSA